MSALARLYVWWPGITYDIEDHIKCCNSCMSYAPQQLSSEISWTPSDFWGRLHLDYASFNGNKILVLVDTDSKWIEASYMSSTTTSLATLKKLYEWFTCFGFSKQIHTDGGPQFTSSEFQDKLKEWNIHLTVSPSYHPASNGIAERAVRTIKDALKKGSTLDHVLFCLRCTPLECDHSPAKFVLSRQPRTRLSGIVDPANNGNQPDSHNKYKPGDSV
ncbi:Uncharacterised protein r2_g3717 [Pycnogonum litorale]